MHNQILRIFRSLMLVFAALGLLRKQSLVCAADPGTNTRNSIAMTEAASNIVAEEPRLLPTGSDEVPELFPVNQLDEGGGLGVYSRDIVPALFGDAGDPGFYATEPGLPEATIIPPMKMDFSRPPTQTEQWWHRLSSSLQDWTSRLSLGGRSLVGNSKQNFVDFAADFEKKEERRATQINLQGQFGESNEVIVANRWFANSTTDFYHGTHWMTFVKLMDQYDQLQNLDYRGTFSGGAGYRFFYEEHRRLMLRVGPGVTTEFYHSPSRNVTTPDLFGEVELRLPVGWERLKWEQKTTVFPSLSALEVARAQSQTAFLYAFDEKERWSLKVGFQYQYISTPNVGRLPNDFTTNVSLVYLRK
jgi:putative salt-induced outer membrane protein YdiY